MMGARWEGSTPVAPDVLSRLYVTSYPAVIASAKAIGGPTFGLVALWEAAQAAWPTVGADVFADDWRRCE